MGFAKCTCYKRENSNMYLSFSDGFDARSRQHDVRRNDVTSSRYTSGYTGNQQTVQRSGTTAHNFYQGWQGFGREGFRRMF